MWRAKIVLLVFALLYVCGSASTIVAQSVDPPAGPDINAVPFEFDPSHLNVVAAEWKGGIGCAPTDPCGSTAGDPQDNFGVGLLLAKTGPTGQFASAGVKLTGVRGITLTELGYDIRKPGVANTDPRGSHCGAGAPRFDITTSDGVTHFLGCNSPPPTSQDATVGLGWIRLRWVAPLTTAFPPVLPTSGSIVSISIVFDEGTDPSGGPDSFGLAVLDNIDVNGQLIGSGPRGPAK